MNDIDLRQRDLSHLRFSEMSASERAEMHWRHWQKIEAGEVNVTIQTLVRLGDALDMDPADLLRHIDEVGGRR